MTIFSTVLDIDSLPSLHIFRCIGILFLIFTVIAGIRIHNMYPRRHDKPSDFPELLTKGPYAICRHPFYSVLIINLYSLALIGSSIYGIIATTISIPLWIYLIKIEEKELIKYWDERYLLYMEKTSMLIPVKYIASLLRRQESREDEHRITS